MTTRTRWIAAALSIGAASLIYSIAGTAQTPALADRVAKLRSEFAAAPTNPVNYRERVQLLEDWGNDLASRGRLKVPQDLMSQFYRLGEFSPQGATAVSRWFRVLSFLEDKGDQTGTLVRVDRNPLVAGMFTTLVFEYTVGDVEIPKGEGLRIGQIFVGNFPRLQTSDPSLDSYVTFQVTSATAKTEPYSSLGQGVMSSIFGPIPMAALRVTSGTLKKGDRIRITVGDTSGSGRGYRPVIRDADDFRFNMQIDPAGDGAFMPAAIATLRIVGDQAASINAVAPSVVAAGEAFALRMRVEDQYTNPAEFGGGKFRVTLGGKPVGEIAIAAGKNTGALEGLKLPAEGAYKFRIASADGRFACDSNPVLVEKNPGQRIYWGELHGHSGWEEGTGSVPRYYEFAKEFAYLDFGSLTGHDLFLSKPGWDEIRVETSKANVPGRFVAFMGYEWTQQMDKGGHHNIFFKTDKGRYVQYRESPRIEQLYQRLRQIDEVDNVLIIPHAHEAGDWNANDADMQKLVEIYSNHGSFEYFGQKFLKKGYRMGLVAASDDHTGHPGYSPATHALRGGLAAVYAPKLDRDSLWTAMKSRATYATSGKRPVIRLTLDGKTPGEFAPTGSIPALTARVLGETAIDHVDVLKNGEPVYTRDFAAPAAGENGVVQIMFHSSTETKGDAVIAPQPGHWWGGWIEVQGATIVSARPVGLDHAAEEVYQVDGKRVWYAVKTRGDFDGVNLTLSNAAADASVNVRLAYLNVDPPNTAGHIRYFRAPGPPPNTPVKQFRFTVAEAAKQRLKYEVSATGVILARKITARGTWDASFTYKPTEMPKPDDYFHLRVVETDGEASWSSPIWIGPEKK